MAPFVETVAPSPWSQENVDVVIIGGGIIGSSTAYFLAKRGVSCVLLEKSEVACEQSSRNWGWCRTQGRDMREMPLILESLALWRTIDQEIGAQTGFKTTGTLHVFPSERELAGAHRWLEGAQTYGTDCRFLSKAEIAKIIPNPPATWQGALFGPSDGRAEPSLAAPAIARAAQRLGVRIHTGCRAIAIETAAGQVRGVVTDRGAIKCQHVVMAGGAWSGGLLKSLGLRLPQLMTIESTARTEKFDGGPDVGIKGGGFSIRKRADGGYTIGYGVTMTAEVVRDSFWYFADFMPLMRSEWRSIRLRAGRRSAASLVPGMDGAGFGRQEAALDPPSIKRDIDKARVNLVRAFPQFRDVAIAESWAGLIDVTPDVVPVISGVATLPGLTISTGYSGHGFGLGLGAGRLTADLVVNDRPVVDPSPFRFDRF